MPKRKTLEAASIECVSSNESSPKTGTGKRMFRSLTNEHVYTALTGYLRSMSLIDDDEQVTHVNKQPNFEVKIEKVLT